MISPTASRMVRFCTLGIPMIMQTLEKIEILNVLIQASVIGLPKKMSVNIYI